MPDLEILSSFVVATAIFAYMPGPATLYAATQTLTRGRRSGLLAAAGLHLGGYVHVVAAASGLAVLFQIMPVLYTGLKYVGAAYLAGLGVKFFFAGSLEGVAADGTEVKADRWVLWQSAVVEILNPKTAVFFIAFLPQFTDPGSHLPLWGQLLVLGAIVNIAFSSADLLYVFFAGKASSFLSDSPAANRLTNRIGGTVLVGLGVHLATSQ